MEEQGGFRGKGRHKDQVFSLRQVMKKKIEKEESCLQHSLT